MKTVLHLIILIIISKNCFSQRDVFSGQIVKKQTYDYEEAKIIVSNDNYIDSCLTDTLGKFSFDNLPIGRYSLKIKFKPFFENPCNINLHNIEIPLDTTLFIYNLNIFNKYHLDSLTYFFAYKKPETKIVFNELTGYGNMIKLSSPKNKNHKYSPDLWWKFYKNDSLVKTVLFDKGSIISQKEYYSNGKIKSIKSEDILLIFDTDSNLIHSKEYIGDNIIQYIWYNTNGSIRCQYVLRNNELEIDFKYINIIQDENIDIFTRINN